MSNGVYHLYILECADGSYYIGQTDNLEQRLLNHTNGRGTCYTSSRLPVILVFSESFPTRAEATQRESQLKKWSRAKKVALIKGHLNDLQNLSKSHD